MRRQEAARRAVEIAEQAEGWDGSGVFVPTNSQPARRAANALVEFNTLNFKYASVGQAFPDVDPGCEPLGSTLLVQIRVPLWSSGGVEIQADARKTELDNTQVARVIALGPLAFHHRDTNKEWPEGAWCKPGDFVRIPKYQGDRWAVSYTRDDGGGTDITVFVILKDLALLGRYPSAEAALTAKAYL
jgi:hypothetical protein